METENYLEQISNVPPPEVREHVKKLFKVDYIVYKSEYVFNPVTGIKERMAWCKCTACNNEFYETYLPAGCHKGFPSFIHSRTNETVGSGQDILCPICGAQVKAKHSSAIGQSECMEQLFPINLQKLKDNKVALLQWVAERRVNNNGEVTISVLPCEGFVFEKKKATRLNGMASNFYYKYFKGQWSQMKKCTDSFGKSEKEMFVNLDVHTLDGTVLENAKLYEYVNGADRCYPVTYLRIYQKLPNVENLAMQGASKLINEYIDCKVSSYYGAGSSYLSTLPGVDLKQKQPHKMLGLNKLEFKEAVKRKWDKKDMEFYKEYREKGLKLEDMRECRKWQYYQLEKCADYELNFPKLFRYIDKQRKRYPKNKNLINPQYIYDYWDTVNDNGGDLTQSIVKWPKAIIKAHDEEVKKQKALENEKYRKAFTELAEKYHKFCFSANGLCIRIAEHPEELTQEGKSLGHCVGRYIDTHSKGEHCIFFIRHEDKPDKSFFTLELEIASLKVDQNRGKSNCPRTEEVKQFEALWLDYIKQLPKESKKHGKRNRNHAA